MGLDFDSLLPYIENLREQAARGIDSKTAATFMIHEIKSYRELGGLQKQLEIARAELEMVNTTTIHKQKELSELAFRISKIIDLEKMAS